VVSQVEHDSERVVRPLVEEFFNGGNYEAADELYAPTFASHAWWHSPVEMASGQQVNEGEESTPDNEKAGLRFWRERFPDSHRQIEELFTAQNPDDAGGADRLVTLWSNTGTSKREQHREAGQAGHALLISGGYDHAA
jgi:hypothetical protein